MATYELHLPRAGRAAAPFLALAVAALLFEADPRLPWLVGVCTAAVFAAAAGIRAAVARHELAVVRDGADRLILNAARHDDSSPLLAWREAELTSPRERQRLRRDLARMLRTADPARMPSASPLQRPAVRANAALFERLDERLADERPVTAKGMLLAESLLESPASPLYNEDADTLVPRALSRVLGALEP